MAGLILDEGRLTEFARDEKVEAEPETVLKAMARQRAPVLRSINQTGAGDQVYGLSHDCIGGALARWNEQHKVQEQVYHLVELEKECANLR